MHIAHNVAASLTTISRAYHQIPGRWGESEAPGPLCGVTDTSEPKGLGA